MHKKILFLVFVIAGMFLFFSFPEKADAAILICDDGSRNCQLTICESSRCRTADPGVCSISENGTSGCNLCTANSNPGGSDCCPIGSAWTKYRASCRLTDPEFGTCSWRWVYDNTICSTADKCTTTTNNPYLNAGRCECPNASTGETGVGGQYKTCCNNSDNRVSSQSCTQMSVDNFNPPFEGVCPANTTAKFCGFGGYPACGQDACGAIITPPDCDTGTCGNCTRKSGVASNSCAANNGTKSCTYTSLSTGGSCNTVTATPDCTIGCTSPDTCISDVCTTPSIPTCTVSVDSNSITQTGATATTTNPSGCAVTSATTWNITPSGGSISSSGVITNLTPNTQYTVGASRCGTTCSTATFRTGTQNGSCTLDASCSGSTCTFTPTYSVNGVAQSSYLMNLYPDTTNNSVSTGWRSNGIATHTYVGPATTYTARLLTKKDNNNTAPAECTKDVRLNLSIQAE